MVARTRSSAEALDSRSADVRRLTAPPYGVRMSDMAAAMMAMAGDREGSAIALAKGRYVRGEIDLDEFEASVGATLAGTPGR